MTSSHKVRALSAALLAAALGFAVLPGCGKPAPAPSEKKEEPKPEPKPDDKKVDPKPDDKKIDPKPGGVGTEPKSLLGPVEPAAEQTAEAFLKDLGQGTAKADALSTNFLKAVGKPLELPADVAAGVSRDAAARWLRRVGENYSFSPSLYRKQAGDAVYWRGQANGRALPPAGGGYSLRLVKDGGVWKVDALVLTSLEIKGDLKGGSVDEAFQEFAVASFVEAVADAGAMSDEAPPAALARAMTPDLRKAWAPANPGGQDVALGYDHSPIHLRLKAVGYGGGATAYTVSKGGDLTYSVELARPAGKKAFVVKLVKGATPGEWLVHEVTEPKG